MGAISTGILGQLFRSKQDPQPPQSDGDGKDLQSRVEEFGNVRWQDLKSAYITYHQQVWDCILKYAGVLWLQWNNSTKMFEVADNSDDDWTPTPEINRFSPAVDSMMSNFAHVPEVEAVPAQMDADMPVYAIAEIASKIAAHIRKVNGLDKDFKGDEDKAGRIAALLTLGGSVFVAVVPTEVKVGDKPVMAVQQGYGVSCPQCDTFNASMQPPMQPACPQCGGPLQIAPAPVPTDTGETTPVMKHGVRIEHISPLEFLPRPGAKFMEEMRYCLVARRMYVGVCQERWGKKAEPDQLFLDGYSVTYDNALQYFYTGSSSSTIRNKEEVMVVELYVEPGKVEDLPEGCYAVLYNGVWQHVEPWPSTFDSDDHPITKANYKNMPTLFFGRTDSFDLSKIQKEVNHYEALIKLHGMTSSAEPIVQDANTEVSEITNRGDKVIKWRSLGPGSKEPHRMQHGTLDNGIYVQRDKLVAEFQNISGAVNVYKGEAPGSITAASAISQLRGQAEQMFTFPAESWKGLWSEVTRKSVKVCQRTMDPTEIAAIVGVGKDVEIEAFQKADLDTLLDYVATTHGLPRTKDERRQEMLTLFDHGVLDPNDINVKQQAFELFGETGMLQQFNKDATRARMENQSVRDNPSATLVPMVGIEDLAVHYSIHAEQIKSLDFDKWNPESKTKLIEHCLQTKEALDMQIEMQARPGGAPEGAGITTPPPQQGGGPGAGTGAGVGGPRGGVAGHPPAGGTGGKRQRDGSRSEGHRKAAQPVPSSNSGSAQIPTGPNGPGAMMPGGNR